uniref:Secreted protein n=1 Tax=Anguilla anguilla TaxID=7936 RepID=A0A0E9S3E5_ANGAN
MMFSHFVSLCLITSGGGPSAPTVEPVPSINPKRSVSEAGSPMFSRDMLSELELSSLFGSTWVDIGSITTEREAERGDGEGQQERGGGRERETNEEATTFKTPTY